MRILDALAVVGRRLDATSAQIALAWLMTRPGVAAPIASATSLEQLDELLTATRVELDPDALAALELASA
jgi:aryl-alcohol dehydrogenase-like predicted oxidoreductase